MSNTFRRSLIVLGTGLTLFGLSLASPAHAAIVPTGRNAIESGIVELYAHSTAAITRTSVPPAYTASAREIYEGDGYARNSDSIHLAPASPVMPSTWQR